MALNSRKIRLPELPIFRKFSLALRQEFARPEEVLQALEDSRRQIRELTQEAPGRFGPGLGSSGSSELVRASQRADFFGEAEAPEEQEEPPESFLKESLRPAPAAGARGERERRHSVDATQMMPAPAARKATAGKVPLPEAPGPLSPEKKAAATSPEVKKPPSPRRTSKKRAAAKRSGEKPTKAQPGSQADAAASAAKQPGAAAAEGEPRSEAAPKEPEVPDLPNLPDDAPATDEEREFWGEERLWGKGRRGRLRGDTGRSSQVGIVRVGAEGRPVNENDGPADEGDE